MRLNSARIGISLLSGAALLLSLTTESDAPSMLLAFICLICALLILYRNLPALSNVSPDSPKVKTLRGVTLFNVGYIAAVLILAQLIERGILKVSELGSRYLMASLFAVPMLVFGNVAPKIPFNRYTGLRLPWTVRDEETWIVAHRILGYISLPLGLLCLVGPGLCFSFDVLAYWLLGAMALWIGIPGILSALFFYRKWR